MIAQRYKILVFVGCYLPGYRAGGPIRSVAAMIETLGNEHNFMIITMDRDFGSSGPYPEIRINEWQRVGKARVFYISPENITLPFLCRLIKSTDHDILYVNSYFSPRFTIMPLILKRLGLIGSKATIVAPRGEFSQGALKLKTLKKKMYIYLSRKVGLYSNVLWQASSFREMNDILAIIGKTTQISVAPVPIVIAPDILNPKKIERKPERATKEPAKLKVIFLSRISPMKNLDGALRMLNGVRGDVTFNIYGPLEDKGYWKKCQELIATLPPNINVHYHGGIDHDNVGSTLASHDIFFLPTHGENFGHVIIEALVAGCPILISDKTPWGDLVNKGVGWNLPLDQPERFTATLQKCMDMGHDELEVLSKSAMEYGEILSNNMETIELNRKLFCNAITFFQGEH